MIDNVKENVVEAEGVVEGEAEAGPGGAVVAPLEAEVVAGGEDTGGRGNACDKPSPPVSETTALGRMIQNCLRAPRAIKGESKRFHNLFSTAREKQLSIDAMTMTSYRWRAARCPASSSSSCSLARRWRRVGLMGAPCSADPLPCLALAG